MARKPTERQQIFVYELARLRLEKGGKRGVKKEAALLAGYPEKVASKEATRLLSLDHIQLALAKAKSEIASGAVKELLTDDVDKPVEVQERSAAVVEAVLAPQRVLQEMACIAIVDPIDLVDQNNNLLDLHEMPERTRRAIASIESRIEVTGRGQDKREFAVTKIKFWDKNVALKNLAQHHGLLLPEGGDDKDKPAPVLNLYLQANDGSMVGVKVGN